MAYYAAEESTIHVERFSVIEQVYYSNFQAIVMLALTKYSRAARSTCVYFAPSPYFIQITRPAPLDKYQLE